MENWSGFFENEDILSDVTQIDLIWNYLNIQYKEKTRFFTQRVKAGILFVRQISDNDHWLLPYNSIKVANDPYFLMCAIKKIEIEISASDEERNYTNQIDINFSTLYKIIYTSPTAQNFWQRKFPGYVFEWKISLENSSWTF